MIHAHPIYVTALVFNELPFLPINTEAAILGEIPLLPFIMPGTMEFTENVVKAMGKRSAALLQNHGSVVAAINLMKAVSILDVIEHTSKIIVTCYTTGKELLTLPDETVALLYESGEWKA